jgi:general secretion pathway protein H
MSESRSEAGFTLLELLVVLAIMGLIVGLVAIRGTDRARLVRLPEAAQNLATGLRLARLRAITSGENFTFKPPAEGAIGISGTKQAVFAPTGAATAADFVLHDDTRTLEVTVDALSGRVEVRGGP